MTGLPRLVSINALEMEDAFNEVVEQILEAVQQVLENTPPELVADVSENGITVTGGGSQIWGLDQIIAERTSIPTRVADDPELCVAYGVSKSLSDLDKMEDGTINIARRRQMR
jgi:rod shape-determining protein MreB